MTDVLTSGGWIETVAPGVNTSLNPATMPHALLSEADGTFTFKALTWDQRDVGDDVTNPVPSIVGHRINDVFFTRNRLGFLTSENVSMSRAGGLFFNFFRETATQVLDTDPIDLSATEKDLAVLTAAVPYNEDIVLFAPKTQFRFTAGQDLFTPKTVQMKPASKYVNSDGCPPVSAGNSIYYAVERGGSAGVMEYTLDGSTNTADAQEVTEHVPRYIPPDLFKIVTCTPERILIALSRKDPSAVYVYSHYTRGGERLQSSWSRWGFSEADQILDITIFGSELILLIQRTDGLHMESMRLATGLNDTDADFVTYLDRRLSNSQVTMTYVPAAKTTTVTLPYSHGATGSGQLQVWERLLWTASRNPKRVHHARVTDTQILIPGDWTNRELFIGINHESAYEFSEQFLRQEGVPRADGRLQLRRMASTHSRSGGYVVEVANASRHLMDTVNLFSLADTAFTAMTKFETGPVRTEGVTLVLPRVPGFGDVAPLDGQFVGVLPDGRFYAEVRGSGTGEVISSVIGAGGSFSFPRLPTGVKSINLMRTRDKAIVHSELFGLEGSGGTLLVGTGEMLLVSNTDGGLIVDTVVGEGGLLRAYDTSLEPSADDAAEMGAKFLVKSQAQAVLAAITLAATNHAPRWLRPLIAVQQISGRFPTEIDPTSLRGVETAPYQLSVQLWAALALATFIISQPAAPLATEARAALRASLGFLMTQFGGPGPMAGLLTEAGAANAEENFLGWFVFKHAAVALADPAYEATRMAMGEAINQGFWVEKDGRYAATVNMGGVVPELTIKPSYLATLWAGAAGVTYRATLHSRWFDYFAAADGSARGFAARANRLSSMGEQAFGVGGLWSEGTANSALSMSAIGDVSTARKTLAAMRPLLTEKGVRNTAVPGEDSVRPWFDLGATAVFIMALNPQIVFGLTVSALWTGGNVVVELTPPYRYTFEADSPNDDGRFTWPVDMKSDDAKVTIKSYGALPFSLLGASWEGFFTARAKKV